MHRGRHAAYDPPPWIAPASTGQPHTVDKRRQLHEQTRMARSCPAIITWSCVPRCAAAAPAPPRVDSNAPGGPSWREIAAATPHRTAAFEHHHTGNSARSSDASCAISSLLRGRRSTSKFSFCAATVAPPPPSPPPAVGSEERLRQNQHMVAATCLKLWPPKAPRTRSLPPPRRDARGS